MTSSHINQLFTRPFLKRERLRLIIALGFLVYGTFWAGAVPDSAGVRTVIIDPGHGGADPGCLGAYSHEADVALDISLMLGRMIEEKYGSSVNVIYTRKTDVHVDLAERAHMANRHKGDLFICIHANSGPSHAKGSEVFALGLHKTDAQLRVAQKENSSILMEDNYETKYKNFNPNDPDAYIFLNFLTSTYLENSLKFAGKIQDHLKNTPDITDRGVKQAGFLVLHQVNMPSVLVETAFLTNPDEEKMLNDSLHQESIALAIFKAFTEYKAELEKVNTEMGHTNVNQDTGTNQQTTQNQNQVPTNQQTTNVVTDDKDKVYFKVQIAASAKPLPLNAEGFKGLSPVEENKGDHVYRYTYGKTHNFEEAKKLQATVVAKGLSTAFITAYLNGNRIDMNKALQMANNK